MIYVEQSLSDTCTYAGNEQLTAANGQGQYRSIFATSSLALPTLFSHVITLQKVNFVPKLSANLIFVGQLMMVTWFNFSFFWLCYAGTRN